MQCKFALNLHYARVLVCRALTRARALPTAGWPATSQLIRPVPDGSQSGMVRQRQKNCGPFATGLLRVLGTKRETALSLPSSQWHAVIRRALFRPPGSSHFSTISGVQKHANAFHSSPCPQRRCRSECIFSLYPPWPPSVILRICTASPVFAPGPPWLVSSRCLLWIQFIIRMAQE